MEIKSLIRPNILKLSPYSSARNEFTGDAAIFLDANESPYETGLNRYPDPLQHDVKKLLAARKEVPENRIFLGNGSDEAIDLVYRVFCVPGRDNVVAPAPTYGMYEVCAEINDVEYRRVPLTADFQLDLSGMKAAVDDRTKVLWLCSPNNPTGNLLSASDIEELLQWFGGIVVIDEAYIDFSMQRSWMARIGEYPRLIVLQTLSKAWGLASVRLGMAFAHETVIRYFNHVKYPYNINLLTQRQALTALAQEEATRARVEEILSERARLVTALPSFDFIRKIYPSDANFLLVKVDDADRTYDYLTRRGIIVRNRNRVQLCSGCLRITVGTPDENRTLLSALESFNKQL